jgi:hypothetical protein
MNETNGGIWVSGTDTVKSLRNSDGTSVASSAISRMAPAVAYTAAAAASARTIVRTRKRTLRT